MDDEHIHYYELTLLPTPAQSMELGRLLMAHLLTSPDDSDSIAGPGLVEPLAPGWVALSGVSGAVRVATNWDRQLPPWAQVVLGREYPGPGRRMGIGSIMSAWRLDWADIRREAHGWTLDLAFHWAAWPGGQLMCGVDTGEGGAMLRLLMGDGSQSEWPAPRPLLRG